MFFSCSQPSSEEYKITGTLENIEDSTIVSLFIWKENMLRTLDRDTLVNGKFEFTGTVDKTPTKMSVMIMKRNKFYGRCTFWVEHTDIKINGSSHLLSQWTVTSDVKEQKVQSLIDESIREPKRIIDSFSFESRKHRNKKEELQDFDKTKLDSVYKLVKTTEFEIAKENFNSYYAVELFYNKMKRRPDEYRDEIKLLYEQMDTTYQNTLFGQGIALKLENIQVPKVGDMCLDFIAYDEQGQKHNLYNYKGKYILLDFWGMGCPPCIKAKPELKAVQEKYADNLAVIGINIDTDVPFWKEQTLKGSANYINLNDGYGTMAGAGGMYGIRGFPTFYLINPDGEIIDKFKGYKKGSLLEKLEEHIKVEV